MKTGLLQLSTRQRLEHLLGNMLAFIDHNEVPIREPNENDKTPYGYDPGNREFIIPNRFDGMTDAQLALHVSKVAHEVGHFYDDSDGTPIPLKEDGIELAGGALEYGTHEPPRYCRRPNYLRELSHENNQTLFQRNQTTCRTFSA